MRGKATRAYIRENPGVVEEFNTTGTISAEQFPSQVTKASVLLELHMRARKKEASLEAQRWINEHPVEAQRMREQMQEAYTRLKTFLDKYQLIGVPGINDPKGTAFYEDLEAVDALRTYRTNWLAEAKQWAEEHPEEKADEEVEAISDTAQS
jgi:hypothetical protein